MTALEPVVAGLKGGEDQRTDDEVLKLEFDGPIVRLTINDPVNRNRLLPPVLRAIPRAMDKAVANPEAKVVLLYGQPDMFCAGATREDLLSMAKGEFSSVFADHCIRSPMRCRLPVISVMQGHAIGGGLLLGLYCDTTVLSERSMYSVNFLFYGFFPSMGATEMIPRRLGTPLATEMFLTGAQYRGAELRRRNAPLNVVAHNEVPAEAERIARKMAGSPRLSLEFMKKHMGRHLYQATDEVWFEEKRLQDITCELPEVQRHIAEDYWARDSKNPQGG